MKKICIAFCFLFTMAINAQKPLLSNIYGRDITSLNGNWNYIVDPLENGYYSYRLLPLENGFFKNQKKTLPGDLVEYDFDKSALMHIPGDWNTQDPKLFFYEGTIWFKKDFSYSKTPGKRTLIYFGAVNYQSKVYVNGTHVGDHIGGFTPFNFDVTDYLVDGNNFVVLKVNNVRHKDAVPTVNTDWWNYGGITRDVILVDVPETYIEDYLIQLDKSKPGIINGWIKLNSETGKQKVIVEIPELKIKQSVTTGDNGIASFEIKAKPQLWNPGNPKLYGVFISKDGERIEDQIGFRTIQTKDKEILLNGQKVFLKGISIHEEAPFRQGRAWSKEDAKTLLGWAKELGCNYVRLAHYPHNELMVREAEKLGLMVWSEIPVYWTISWENAETYKNAQQQLSDMIYRDKNRCAVIIWSIANETPHGEARDKFLSGLAAYARSKDNTRLISMAMEVTGSSGNVNNVEDNLNQYVDIISFNQYKGWYSGTPDQCEQAQWRIPYNKPIIISEFGGGALQGLHGDKGERWTEEYQEYLYIKNLEMLDRIDGLAGTSPWILMDFRSARRQLPGIQDFFNRKGLVSETGIKKKAFFIMQDWYKTR